MPTVEQNRQQWNKAWTDPGDSWSQAWGGVRSQWFGAILPRIHAFIPTDTILEIGPGYGRWTQFLITNCRNLIGVDLAEECIRACRERFGSSPDLAFFANDGKSLDMISDESISFVFSFDSLVHADADAMEAYVNELSRKLIHDGVAFIHHSNLGAYKNGANGELPEQLSNPHWRSENMSGKRFEEFCRMADLRCISQEMINWGGDVLNDCFSVVARKDSHWAARPSRVFQNGGFMAEAERLRQLSELYGYQTK